MMSWLRGRKSDNEPGSIQWKDLDSMELLDVIEEQSGEKPQVIFKHSTRCGISYKALDDLEKSWDIEGNVDMWLLDLLSHRDISNAVSERFGVMHQSPQVIVIRDGEVVHDVSHHSISVDGIAACMG